MRLGVVTRLDSTGLAVQTQAFVKHLNPDKILVPLMPHQPLLNRIDDIPEYIWYPTEHRYPTLEIFPSRIVDEFLHDLDVVLTCETPYNYYLFEKARELGVKTVLQLNYEFFDYMRNDLPEPDLFLTPSMWHHNDVLAKFPDKTVHLPVPVDRQDFPFTLKTELKSILHTVGTGTGEDRNGTNLLLEAIPYIHPDIQIIIKSQNPVYGVQHSSRISYIQKRFNHPSELYGSGDAYVMPRRFGGLCLPFNEALSCGMPVIAPECSPQTEWGMVKQKLIPVAHKSTLETRNTIEVNNVNPLILADTINHLYDSPEEFKALSEHANELAETISWNNMKSKYKSTLSNL